MKGANVSVEDAKNRKKWNLRTRVPASNTSDLWRRKKRKRKI